MSHATFTFGRFSPPTVGHKKLVDKVVNHAKKAGGDHYVFASQTQDSKKNPLEHGEKVGFMRKFFPHANVSDEKSVRTPIEAMKHLHGKGYKKVTMVVGSDRVQEMSNLLHRYNGKEYNFDHIEVKSAGNRDPDAEGVTGMSASKMRDHATKKNFNEFKKGVPNPEHAEELYHSVRRGLKLESTQKHFKALFLVGGPGSGKDILIKSGLQESGMAEISLDKLHKTIVEKSSLRELDAFRSIFINGNADDYNKINVCRTVLEHMGYDTSMVFVYTENSESKRRNDARISSGAKTFSEQTRLMKYNSAIQNMKLFSEDFSSFFLFDNSRDFKRANEKVRKEIIGWTEELFEGVSNFISSAPTNPSSIKWLVESGKIDTTNINQLFEEIIGESNEDSTVTEKAVLGRAARGAIKKGAIQNDPREGGIPKSSDNRAERVVAAEAKEAEADTSKGKKVHKKPAVNPGKYFDSRIGAVPSGGIGLTAYSVAEKKSFSNFRKITETSK